MTYWETVKRLRLWQPGADHIERVKSGCPCCGNRYLLSYTLETLDAHPDPALEYCGHWCAACGFSGASSRPKSEQAVNPFGAGSYWR